MSVNWYFWCISNWMSSWTYVWIKFALYIFNIRAPYVFQTERSINSAASLFTSHHRNIKANRVSLAFKPMEVFLRSSTNILRNLFGVSGHRLGIRTGAGGTPLFFTAHFSMDNCSSFCHRPLFPFYPKVHILFARE